MRRRAKARRRNANWRHGTEKRWHSEERNRAGMDRLGDGIAEHGSDGHRQGEARMGAGKAK